MDTPNILIIDNDKDSLFALSALFYKEGYRVSCANSGNEGIEKAKNKAFRLIVTEIDLPDIRTERYIGRLRRTGKVKAPILVISRSDDTEEIEELFQQGIEDYIVKPPRMSYLLKLSRRMIHGAVRK
jgi:DNA-binding response OmpR family regulator